MASVQLKLDCVCIEAEAFAISLRHQEADRWLRDGLLGYFGREWFAMKLTHFCLIAGLTAVSSVAQAEVEYPLSRNTVAPGELYHFDQFGDWSVDCVRDPDGEDYCSVAQTISALDFGLELEFLIAPYTSALVRSNADVDIAPRAYIAISPYSTAEHYEDYSAQISSLEGEPFDAFWCPLTDAEDCNQGPELDISDLERLTRATMPGSAMSSSTARSSTACEKHKS